LLKGIIFDLDGTLISLHVDGTAFRREIAQELSRSGFRMDLIDTVSKGVYVQNILDQARNQIQTGLVKGSYEDLRERTFRALDTLEVEWITHSRLMPGAERTLQKLSARAGLSKTLALLTNSGRAATRFAMENLRLGRYFSSSFTRDDLPAMKPSPDGITTALRKLGLEKDEVIYVGDSPTDILASKGAGIPVASVATGRYDAGALRALGPDYTLRSLEELEGLVHRLD